MILVKHDSSVVLAFIMILDIPLLILMVIEVGIKFSK